MKSGISAAHLDPQVSPRDDLFRHANGGWLDSHEIPADRANISAFIELLDLSEQRLYAIVEELTADESVAPDSVAAKVRDLYADFMDTAAIEAAGLDPLRPELARVADCETPDQLVRVAGELSRDGVSTFTVHYTNTDAGNPDQYRVYFRQGGLGLPDESYYTDEQYTEIREAYGEYLRGLFEILGLSDPQGRANDVLDVEARISESHWDVVASRDAVATYNPLSGRELAQTMGRFPWEAYAEGLAAPEGALDSVVLAQPSFLAGVGELLAEVPISAWRNWLKATLAAARAPYLSSEISDHVFAFYGTVLNGQEQQRDRWKRGVELVESALGEGLGQLYVERHFPPAAKARMEELVANVVEAFRQRLAVLPWMGEDTRERALVKLGTFRPKIGYPSRWRDHSALEIVPGDLLGNIRRASAFEADREMAKIGQPIDREEWFMNPQTVNAYYNPGMNEIVFPAAILQPPFFDAEADDAVNYGGIGAVIGHEIGHGFDDQGSKYDERGMLRDWWTEEDRSSFDALAQRVIEQFNAVESVDLPGQCVNGALTVGENIGDLVGLTMGLAAYRIATDETGGAPEIDGMSGIQRFFIGWAQVWRGKMRTANAQQRLATDPHAPIQARAAAVRNLDEFHEAFEVTEGDGMYLSPTDRIRIF